jgi:hypothetical protein
MSYSHHESPAKSSHAKSSISGAPSNPKKSHHADQSESSHKPSPDPSSHHPSRNTSFRPTPLQSVDRKQLLSLTKAELAPLVLREKSPQNLEMPHQAEED